VYEACIEYMRGWRKRWKSIWTMPLVTTSQRNFFLYKIA